MFVNKLSNISRAHILKSKKFFNVKSSTYYFQMKIKILAGFQICMSVLLSGLAKTIHINLFDEPFGNSIKEIFWEKFTMPKNN